VEISFEDAAFGVSRTVVVTKPSSCLGCKGTGAKPGSKFQTCSKCGGKGSMKEARGTFFGTVTVETPCRECAGSGKRPETPCKDCSGSGVERRSEEIRIDIPAGIEDGEMIRLTGLGEYVNSGVSGDMYVKVHVRKHAIFRREGADIYMDLPVKVTDALMGATYQVPSLEGVALSLPIPEGTNHGTLLRIKEKGIVVGKGRRGSLVVRVSITMPTKLSKQAKDLISKLRQEGL
jgi:molecular chaperone DnaJ